MQVITACFSGNQATFCEGTQMRWAKAGARRMQQLQLQVWDGELRQSFERWYPGVPSEGTQFHKPLRPRFGMVSPNVQVTRGCRFRTLLIKLCSRCCGFIHDGKRLAPLNRQLNLTPHQPKC